MYSVHYTALIRTFNSEMTLRETIASLDCQSNQPSKYVFVDSGSNDRTLAMLPAGATVHHYRASKFNYSESLNAGMGYIDTPYTVIMSSHTTLENSFAIQFAIELMEDNEDIAAAYFVQDYSEQMQFRRIGSANFSGFNGVWNTCAIYKTSFLKKRQFRPEVFSAEDQEWSNWLFCVEKKFVARVSGAGMSYNNPKGDSISKGLNERLSVAIFVKMEMQNFAYLARLFYRTVRPISKARERIINLMLLCSLLHRKLKRVQRAGV